MDGTEGRVLVGVYRNTSTVAKVKRERFVWERDSGPRLDKTGGKGK